MLRPAISSEVVGSRWGCRACRAGGTESEASRAASRHHAETGHQTWAEVAFRTVFGANCGVRASSKLRDR